MSFVALSQKATTTKSSVLALERNYVLHKGTKFPNAASLLWGDTSADRAKLQRLRIAF